jgi:hypothetical protein
VVGHYVVGNEAVRWSPSGPGQAAQRAIGIGAVGQPIFVVVDLVLAVFSECRLPTGQLRCGAGLLDERPNQGQRRIETVLAVSQQLQQLDVIDTCGGRAAQTLCGRLKRLARLVQQ